MSGSALLAPVRMSTDALPEADRLSVWREAYGRNIVHFDIEPLDDRPFRAAVTFHSLPGVSIAIGERSDSRYVGSKKSAAKTQGQVILSLTTKGFSHSTQLGREVEGGPGSAWLLSGAEPGTATLRADGAFKTLSIPRAALQALVPDLDRMLVRPIDPENQALRLLIGYLDALPEGGLDPAVAGAFAAHVVDLAALALGARGEAREIAGRGGARAALRRAILAEIDARVEASGASSAAVARKLGISERYLRAILEESGRTFSELLMERRLNLAWRRLTEPASSHRTVSEIAFACGFSDISHFNRCFRRRFGDTPTGVRVRAAR